jgi:nitroreductase
MSPTATPSKPVASETLLAQLEWRYAVKKFDPARKIAPEDWHTLERALVLAPSSYGLQPWKFVVVGDPELRAKLRAASWNQSQITDASHLMVFASRKGLDAQHVARHIDRVREVRSAPAHALEGYKTVMTSFVSKPGFDVDGWSGRQLYLALGTFLTCAAMLGIDTCPMEGIETAEYDELLGLDAEGYGTRCVATAGFRSQDDASAKLPKVRFEHQHVIRHVG